jgi:hypothetical protein
MTRFFPPLLLALCSACVALSACDRNPAADINMTIENARKEAQAITARLAALPPQCVTGDADGTAGQWIDSQNGTGEPGQPYTYDFAFKAPIRSGAFHVALNAKALQNLENVETRDAAGKWTSAWSGAQASTPAGCEFVKMTQRFATGAREVAALRITIRPDREKIIVAEPRVLKAG